MIASFLILVFSLAMFVYWFRYTCLMILRTRTAENFAARVATANHLCFLSVEEELKHATASAVLDPLQRALENDFRMLKFLADHASGMNLDIEHRILAADYRMMSLYYKAIRRVSVPQSRRTLEEMSGIIRYLANAMGQRMDGYSEA